VWLFAYLGCLKIFPCCDDPAWPKHTEEIKLIRVLILHSILLLVCTLELIESAGGIMHSYKFFFVGSNWGGKADGYYGHSGREFVQTPYNITAVTHSLTGEAIASLLPPSLPDEEEMLQLRAKSTLNCTVPTDSTPCDPTNSSRPCLFDLETDPCERNNLADSHPEVLLEMLDLVKKYEATLVPQLNKPPDVEGSDPRKFNNTWSPWVDT
jgi:hypothetical protein